MFITLPKVTAAGDTEIVIVNAEHITHIVPFAIHIGKIQNQLGAQVLIGDGSRFATTRTVADLTTVLKAVNV